MEDLIETGGELVVLRPGGNLSGDSAADLKERVRVHLAAGSHVVLDMSDVAFTDSEGLSALVAVFKTACASPKRLGLASIRPNLMALLELTRLHRVFELHEDVAAARASMTGERPR